MSVPERLGKFQITGVLGKGAMGVVYKGYDPVIKRPVAVKTIRNDWEELTEADTRMLAARFRQEAQAAGRLAHAGIVGVYEYGEEAGYTYIAMEYVEGSSLREYFNRKVSFPEPDVVSLMSQLLEGLAVAHDQGIWHRDIKPANLIVTAGGRLKIADFGVARVEASELTQVSDLLGTHGYIAPECYRGAAIDHRSDLFAAGSVLYQLLVGESPFSGTPESVMYRVCNVDPPPPSRVNAARGAHLDRVTLTALAKDPAQRFASAREFLDMMRVSYKGPVAASISEATVIRPVSREPAVPSASDGPASQGASGAAGLRSSASLSSGGPLPTQWDAQVLGKLESCLTALVGPVARVLVRRTSRAAADLPALVEQISAQLATDADRKVFARAVERLDDPTIRTMMGGGSVSRPGSLAGGTRPGTIVGGFAPSEKQLARATDALSTFVGPIARVLVKRAAVGAADLAGFHRALAQAIENDADRQRFLKVVASSGE
jgi:eukaryotic-like serine/threonine-protein kinase